MMILRKTFIDIYEPLMTKKGFLRKNSIYHRMVNDDIVQMLSYRDLKHSFTIQFLIAPLCAGYEYSRCMDETRLGILLGNETYAEWEKSSDCTKGMKESLEVCKEYLFPYFDSINDCYSYISGMKDIYRKAYGSDGERILLMHNILYGPGLKTAQYKFAINSSKAIIAQNEYSIKRNRECNIEPTKERIDRLKQRHNDLRRLEEAIKDNDINYINACIQRLETLSRDSYIKSFG